MAFNLGTFEVCLEFHDSSHDHKVNPIDIITENGSLNNSDEPKEEKYDTLEENDVDDEFNKVEFNNTNEPDPDIIYMNLDSKNSKQKTNSTENIDDNIQDKNDFLPDEKEETTEKECKQPFQGGYFLIILANGLSNVAFKFPTISYEDEPTEIINSIKVRNVKKFPPTEKLNFISKIISFIITISRDVAHFISITRNFVKNKNSYVDYNLCLSWHTE